MRTHVVTETGRSIKLITLVPEKKSTGWCDAQGVCGIDSEGKIFFHPDLCDLHEDAWDAGVMYLVRIDKCFCPLVPLEWAIKHSLPLGPELAVLENRVRQAISLGTSETQSLLTLHDH
jgi:hypothetical protein